MDTSILQPGDFIFFSGKSFVSRGIKMFTKSKWSHVAMYVGGGKGYIIEATAAGVEKNELEPLLRHTDAVAVARIPGLTVEDMERMKDKAYSMLGDKYDFWQLITFSLYFSFRKIGIIWPGFIGDNAGQVVCSALCAMCALVIPVKFAKSPKQVAPQTIYESDKVSIIFEQEFK